MMGFFTAGINSFMLYPLQITASDLRLDTTISTAQIIIFSSVFAAIIIVMVIINVSKKDQGWKGSGSSGKKTGGIFSFFALRRLARTMGLNREQTRMLDYIFRIDAVTDPEKSISTPSLLDRHFKRAYRIIEHSSDSEAEAQSRLNVLFSTRNILENSAIGSITSTRQLKDDTVLVITHGKEKLEVSVISAKEEHIAVEIPKTVLGSQIKIPRGNKLSVVFFTKSNKGFTFETRVIGYHTTHGIPSLVLAHSGQLRFLSQRRFRRKQSVIACFMFLVYVEGKGKKQKLAVDKRRMQGSIKDISVGGCSIKTNAPVQVGAKFKIEFNLSRKNIAVVGQVLRTNRTGMNTIIHVKFLRVTKKSMNIINAFVYEYANE